MSTLVISAVKFEVNPLLEKLNEAGNEIEFAEAGIGSIKSARSAFELREKAKGKDVVYVGSCGVFGEFTEPKLVRGSKTVWLPVCERGEIAWSIEGIDKPFNLPEAPSWASSLEAATVICCPTIAKSPEISKDAANRVGIDIENELLVENLELYSVAEAVCSTANSFVSIFGITNAIGPDSRTQWKDNFKTVAGITSDYILENLF